MRKKIRSHLLSAGDDGLDTPGYQAGHPLTDAQLQNLRFRTDCRGSDGARSVFRDDATRCLAWREHRDKLIARSLRGRRCPAFWQYEPDVPEMLRRYSSVEGFESTEAAAAEHGRISMARTAWLLGHPEHHLPGELAVLEQLVAPGSD